MDNPLLDLKIIDRVFKQTLQALEEGKEQLFSISEIARSEYNRLKAQYEQVRLEVQECILEVDDMEKHLRMAKSSLAKVSRNFSQENETAIRKAYEAAEEFQVKVGIAREREKALRMRRDDLERSLKNLEEMVKKAEGMVNLVGMAVNLMEGNVKSLDSQVEGLKEKYEIAARIIHAQEEERLRVSREIHDGPAQSMANVVLRAEICEKIFETRPEELKLELQELKKLVKSSLQEIRRIIFNLRPMALDDLGLIPTLRRYLEECKASNLPVRLYVSGEEQSLNSAVEVAVFRLVQEAVNNAQRHAKASRIAVKLEFLSDRLRVIVVDDGIGFDVERALSNKERKDHFGLLSMKERVQLLQGVMEIKSAPGQGTQIAAELALDPINNDEVLDEDEQQSTGGGQA